MVIHEFKLGFDDDVVFDVRLTRPGTTKLCGIRLSLVGYMELCELDVAVVWLLWFGAVVVWQLVDAVEARLGNDVFNSDEFCIRFDWTDVAVCL